MRCGERKRESTHNTVDRSIDPSMGTSIGNTPLPIASWLMPRKGSKDERTKESKGGERSAEQTEGGRESPEGPLVAQLSHLPIGPSHVLICLLVNPRRSSFIVYFALDFRGTPAPARAYAPLSPCAPGLLDFFFLFPVVPLSFLSLAPFLVISLFLSGRAKSRGRSLQNEFDRRLANGTADRYGIVYQLSFALNRKTVRVCVHV